MISGWLQAFWHKWAGGHTAACSRCLSSGSDKKDTGCVHEEQEEFPVPPSATGKKKRRRDQKDLRSCFDDDTWNSGSNFY